MSILNSGIVRIAVLRYGKRRAESPHSPNEWSGLNPFAVVGPFKLPEELESGFVFALR